MWMKHEARDPAEIVERREARTCKGCAFESAILILGDVKKACEKGRRHGKRCKKYEEKEGKFYERPANF